MRRSVALMMCMLLFSATHARAEFYRWVDREGKEFFTNDREKVPQEYRGSLSEVRPDENRVVIGTKAGPTKKSAATGGEHQDKYGRGEAYWHNRAANLRRELHELQAEYDDLVKQEQDRERRQGTVIGRKKKASANYDKKKTQLEKKIATAKHRLEVELPEEARKADAYPGWLRE